MNTLDSMRIDKWLWCARFFKTRSIAAREHLQELRRLAPEPALALSEGRPTKRDRRQLERERSGGWGDRWSASVDG